MNKYIEHKEYNNWLICLESDNFASFIKMWFAHLASIHDLVLKNADEEERSRFTAEMHGDGDFLRKYRDQILPELPLLDSTRSAIIECYNISKNHIKQNYPEYFHITFYKKILDSVIFNKEPISILYDSYLLDVLITKTNKLLIGLLLSENNSGQIPLLDKLKKRYISVEIELIPPKNNIWIIDDAERFYKNLWYSLRKELWKNINASEGTKAYNSAKFKLDKIAFLITNLYCKNVNIQEIIYEEKINKEAQDKEIKDWFHEFTYALRNVLFHRVVNPFDFEWSGIVKIASQALRDFVTWNIEQLRINSDEETTR